MTIDQLLTLVVQSGICGALCVWFVHQSHKREDRMAKRINEQDDKIARLEQEMRGELMTALSSTRDVIRDNTAVLEQINDKLFPAA